jgi:hypothetical protein
MVLKRTCSSESAGSWDEWTNTNMPRRRGAPHEVRNPAAQRSRICPTRFSVSGDGSTSRSV